MSRPFATIDIGTNSVLLLIALTPVPSPVYGRGELGVRADLARITGLGKKLSKTFHPESKERTLQALQEYASLCRDASVQKVVCVGTAAFRKAADGPQFMEEIGRRFGWETRIISGEEEARLSFLSVERDFGSQHKNLIALDIGGGSTEIISEEGGVSLELGTVVLTEKYLRQDPPTEGEFKDVIHVIKSKIPPNPPLTKGGRGDLIALAGTVTTLSSVNQHLERWDPEKIQGSIITLSELESMITLFRRTTNEERRAIPGMIHGREETILAGSLILKAVMEKLGVQEVIVSDRGLRYGLFYDHFGFIGSSRRLRVL